ncbi:FxsA family protein [Stutzerimonas azotifigens]|uniref:FxsA family protein n=1 Tax=Stutzerimonas azotifigens TaxID=291995 RepID=UPI0003F60FE7|nr:FxsA family protein [Stutzerimonas azotifigens]
MRIFLFLFLLFPVLELVVLIKVGSAIGVLATLFLLVLGGLGGVLLMRLAGFATAWRARERLARGELPEREMLQGLLLAVAGGLLILPGFISDVLALVLLFPPSRKLLLGQLQRRIELHMTRTGPFGPGPGVGPAPGRSPDGQRPNVIEGEWERRDR